MPRRVSSSGPPIATSLGSASHNLLLRPPRFYLCARGWLQSLEQLMSSVQLTQSLTKWQWAVRTLPEELLDYIAKEDLTDYTPSMLVCRLWYYLIIWRDSRGVCTGACEDMSQSLADFRRGLKLTGRFPCRYSNCHRCFWVPCHRELHEKVVHSVVDLTESITVDGRVIWKGTHSQVQLASWNGETVALKVLLVKSDEQQGRRRFNRRLHREIRILSLLHHPNIIPFYGLANIVDDIDGVKRILTGLPAMVTPWYENGSADQYLATHKPSCTRRLELSTDVSRGLEYLHSLDVIVHGDLKPANVLVDNSGNARLCDFGISSLLGAQAAAELDTTTVHVGTAKYAAPEIILPPEDVVGYNPTPASDIFSLGCVIYEFVTDKPPYSHFKGVTYSKICVSMHKRQHPAQRAGENDEIWTLLSCCWKFEPSARPSASQVKEELVTIHNLATESSRN